MFYAKVVLISFLLCWTAGASMAQNEDGWRGGLAAAYTDPGEDLDGLDGTYNIALFAEYLIPGKNYSWFTELGYAPHSEAGIDIDRTYLLIGSHFYSQSRKAWLSVGAGYSQFQVSFGRFSGDLDTGTLSLGGGVNIVGGLDAFARYDYSLEFGGDENKISSTLLGLRYTF